MSPSVSNRRALRRGTRSDFIENLAARAGGAHRAVRISREASRPLLLSGASP
ncbi:Hypothetical protein A7982_07585 [Minicystis rosea]|nr:Hypothetical protein A7982_07585 [Minicystis rosea]